MGIFDGTSDNDSFTGVDATNLYRFDIANLSSGDTVDGTDAPPPTQIDTLEFLTAGFIASAQFAGVTGIEIITLADGATTIEVTDQISNGGPLEIIGGDVAPGSTGGLVVQGAGLTVALTVQAGRGVNLITSGSGNDHLIGGDVGADHFFAGAGADIIDGGLGSGISHYESSPEGVVIDLADGKLESGGHAEGDLLINIDHLHGSGHGDILRGNDIRNALLGNGGDDLIDGRGGNDDLRGGFGDDEIYGGAGNDTIIGQAGDDLIEGGAGADTIDGGTHGDAGGQFSNLGDFASYESSDAGVTVNLTNGAATGIGGDAQGDTLTGIENLIGSGHADVLGGDANANILIGNGGADQLRGNGGDDYLIFDADDTVVDGGAGRDTIAPTAPGDLTPVSLDLTGAAQQVAGGRITNVEVVDLRGTAGNSLTIDVDGVNAISGTADKIVVFANASTPVDIGSGWLQDAGASFEADPIGGAPTAMTRYYRADGSPGEILIQGGAALTVDLADAPEVDLNGVNVGLDYTTSYVNGSAPEYITDAGATLVDLDDDVTTLTITLTNAKVAGEVLSLDGVGSGLASSLGLTVSGDGTGAITISGTASAAHYQTLLQSVQYFNPDVAPTADTTPRVIEVVATDATTLSSATATTTVNVAAPNDEPVLLAETQVSTNEDTSVTGRLPQAFDPDGDAVTISLVGAAPTLGNVVLNGDGTFTYTPTADANGQDSFTIEAVDARGATTQAVVTVTIDPENDAPVISAINTTAAPEEGIQGIFEVAVTDADGDTPVVVAAVARHGDITFTGTTLTYTPDAGFSGADKITVLVSDGNGGTAVKELSFTVAAGTNNAPVVSAVNLATSEDHVLSGKLPKGTDADGDPISVVASSGATTEGGTVTVNADGTFVYNPAADFNGNDTFTYQVTDGTDTTNVTVTIAVQPKNDGPTAVNDTASANEGDSGVIIDVLANDTDPDVGDTLTIVAAIARHGDVSLTAGNIALEYTPDANFSGTDTIHYVIRDAAGATSVATVTVTVSGSNDAPEFAVSSTSATTSEDTVLTGRVPSATDADGDALTYSAGSTAPALGTVSVGADGSYIYTPNANATGPDSFTVDVSDGTDTTTITVNVTIAAVNDAPTATNVTGITADEGGAAVTINLGSTGVDPLNAVADVDGDTLSVLTAVAKHGSVSFTGTEIAYTPDADFTGNDTITYIVSDGNGGHAVASITVAVGGANDAPVVAGLSVSGVEDQVLSGQLPAATDPDGDVVSYTTGTFATTNGSVTIAADGSFAYTPDANYHGPDSFTFDVTDGNGGTTTATVTIDVASVNDAPTATSGLTASTGDNTSVTISTTFGTDTADGDTVTLAGAIAAHGTVQIDGGSIVYTPLPGYTGNDTITFVVSDGNGASSTGTIAVTINDSPDDPVFPVSAISVATNEDNAVTATIPLAVDPDGTAVTYSIASDDEPTKGTVGIDSTTGQFTYTPNADANGADSFVVTASDGNGGITTLTVNVNVAPENDAPEFTGLVAPNDDTTTNEDTPLVLTLAFTDIESDTVTIVSVASQVGIVSVTGTNELTYIPGVDLSDGFTSHDIITVIASDGKGGYTTTDIVVAIDGVNDAPEVFTNAGLALDEGGAAGITLANLLVDDSDNDPSEIVFTIDAAPAHGTLNGPLGALGVGDTFTQQDILDGNVVYIHDGSDPAGIPGDSFEFTVSDGDTSIAGQTFNFAILAQNDAPTVADTTPALQLTTNEDTATNISLQVSDSDSASITVVLEASNGRINVNAGSGGAASVVPSTQLVESVTVTGSVTDVNAALASIGFVPNEDYKGPASVQATVIDGDTTTVTTVPITVVSVNDAPEAISQEPITLDEGGTAVLTLTNLFAEDADNQSLDLAIRIDSLPTSGTLAIGGVAVTAAPATFTAIQLASGQVTFTHDGTDPSGLDGFQVTVLDPAGAASNQVTIGILANAVNDAPTASAVAATTNEDTSVTIPVTITDGDSTTLSIISAEAGHGNVAIGSGELVYTPDSNFNGSDTVTYTVSDGDKTFTATVDVTINPVDDAPQMITTSRANVQEGGRVIFSADNLEFVDVETPDTGLIYRIDGLPLHGTVEKFIPGTGNVTLAVGDTFTQRDISFGRIIYIHDGSDGATQDGMSLSLSQDGGTSFFTLGGQHLRINIDPVNDAPSDIALGGTSVDENAAGAVVGAVTVTDAEGGPFTYSVNDERFEVISGNLQLKPGVALDFETEPTVALTITATDAGGASYSETIDIAVSDVAEGLTITSLPQVGAVVEDETPTGSVAFGQVTAVDADGTTPTFEVFDGTNWVAGGTVSHVYGTFSLDTNTGGWTFTLNNSAAIVQALGSEGNAAGQAVFLVRATDGSNPTVGVPVAIAIGGINDAPEATSVAAGTHVTDEDTQLVIGPTDVDALISDAETVDSGLVLVNLSAGNGSVTWDAGTGITYTPDADFNGTDTITFQVQDPMGTLSAPATIAVGITAVNDAPLIIANAGLAVGEGETVVINAGDLLATDVDNAPASLTFTLTGQPAGGTVMLNGAASLTFTMADLDAGLVTYAHGGGETAANITFSLSDGAGGALSAQTFAILLNNVNDAPVVGSLTGATPIGEGTVGATAVTVGAFTVTDPDGSGPTFTVSDARFQVVADTTPGNYLLQAQSGANFDYEGEQQISVLVDVNDGGTSVSRTFTVDVANIEEGGPSFFIGAEAATVAENTPLILGPYVAEDADDSAVTYTLTGADAAKFSISTDGILTFNGADYEGASADNDDVYNVTVNATSTNIGGGTTTATRDVAVTVTNVNEAPTDITLAAASIDENTSGATVIGALTVSDSDSASFTWTVNDERFAVDGSGNLVLAAGASLDFEATPTVPVTVTATDAGGLSFSKTFTITVNDVNEAPVAADVVATVAEDAADTDVLATVAATDPDAGATLSYSIVGGSALFEIDSNGQISLFPGQSLDAETATSHTLTVEVSDGTLTDTATVVINVTNVADNVLSAVSDSDSVSNSVSENAAAGTLVGITALATDADLGATVTYSLTDNAGGRFAIDATTGVVTVATGAVLDYESATGHTIEVTASSSDGGSSSATFSINLTDANEFHVSAPTDTNAAANTISEAATAGTAVGITLAASDADATTNAVTYTLSDARFEVAAAGVVQVASGATFNYDTERSIDLTVTATSADGSSATNAFRISVTDANAAPVASAGSLTTNEDTTGFGLLAAADADGDALTFTLASSGGPANGSVVIAPNGLYIYTPAANYNGADSFTYQVSDGHGGTHTATVSITVSAVNDTPIALADTSTGNEDATQVIAVLANDTDPDGNTLSVTAAAAGHGAVSINASNELVYTPTANWSGTDTIVYTISDGNGGTTTGSVSVTVSPANDAPVANGDTGAITEGGAAITGNVLTNDTDVDAGTTLVTTAATTAGTYGQLALDGSGGYTYTLGSAAEGLRAGQTVVETFSYTVSDQATPTAGTATGTLAITVTGTNDGPTVTNAVADQSSAEDAAWSFTVPSNTFADADLGDTRTLSAGLADGSALPAWLAFNAATGTFTGTPPANFDGAIELAVTATDGSGASVTDAFTLTVSAVDDAAVAGNDAATLVEDVGVTTSSSVISNVVTPQNTISTSGNLLANDNDVESGAATSVTALTGGTQTAADRFEVDGTLGKLVVFTNGDYVYFADNAAIGIQEIGLNDSKTETFSYTNNQGQTADLTITIRGTNDGVVAVADTAAIDENSAGPGTGGTAAASAFTIDVLANDTDPDRTDAPSALTLTAASITDISATGVSAFQGTVAGIVALSGSGANNQIVFTPGTLFDQLDAGDVATVTISYTVQDAGGLEDTGTLTLTVTGTNDAPVVSAATNVTGSATEIADNATGENSDTHSATGSFEIMDVDLDDTHTVSVVNPTTTSTYSLLGTFTPTLNQDSPTSDKATINWTFSVSDADLDKLAATETITQTYTVRVTDSAGATVDQDVEITIQGTNDAPVITSTDPGTGFTETAATTADATPHTTSGTVSFTDVDLNETGHTASKAVTVTGTTTGFAATALSYLTLDASVSKNAGDGSGSVGWSFSAPDQDFDYLSDGEQIELKYTVTITDAAGATAAQDITITVTGTNDAPDFTGMAATHDLDEASGQTGQTAPQLDATGSLAFSDVDLTDTGHTATATVAVTGVGTAETELPSSTALVALLNLTTTKESGSDTGSVAYDFKADDNTFDYLADGEQVTLTYTVTVDDGDVNSDNTQTVAITVTGTNDAPVITVGSVDSASASLTEGDAPLNASGTLTVTDVDISDTVSAAKLADTTIATGGTGDGANTPSASALDAMFAVTSTAPEIGNAATSGSIGWAFNAPAGAFDYLGEGQTQEITYTIRATDDAGTPLSDDQTVTITITGTNDGPTLDLDANDSTDVSTAFAATFTENGAAVAIVDTDADIADLDQTATITEATITLTNAQVGDVLDTSGVTGLTVTTSGAIPGSYTVTLSGTASLADYETALKAITFSNTSGDDPNTTDRVIEITVTDDQGAVSNTATSTIAVDLDLNQAVHVTDGTNVVATFDTIQAAIDAIGDSGTATGNAFTANAIEVQGNYTLNEAITIDVPLSITGQGAGTVLASVVIEDGALDTGETVTLKDLAVTKGTTTPANANGIIYQDADGSADGTLILDNVAVSGFESNGLFVGSSTVSDLTNVTVNISNSTFTNNVTDGTQGTQDLHLFNFAGNATLTNVTVSNTNSAQHGIAIQGWTGSSAATGNIPGPIGTIDINNVTVTGTYAKSLVYINGYNELDGLDLTGGLNLGDGTTLTSAGWTGLYIQPQSTNGTFTANGAAPNDIDLTGVVVATDNTTLGTNGGFWTGRGVVVTGSTGDEAIIGSGADDHLVGFTGGGADTIIGGAGTDDLVQLFNATDPDGTGPASAQAVTFTISKTGGAGIGSTDDDLLVQMGLSSGGAANALGQVTLDGVEDLLITLGSGGDTVVVTNGLGGTSLSTSTITIDGGAGADTANIGLINQDKAVGVDFDGAGGIDTVSFAGADADAGVVVNLGTNSASSDGASHTLTNVENVIGSDFADTITGGAGDNVITGGLGNDTIAGGGGTDTAVFSGNVSAYTITIVTTAGTPAGAQVGDLVVSGTDGTDVIGTDVESLHFSGSNTTIDLTLGVRVFNASNQLVSTHTTIQAALDAEAALSGTGTVQVIAANYTAPAGGAEALTIYSGVNLVTDTNAGIDPNTGPARGAEVTIASVTLASGNVTVDGFTISGSAGAAISQSVAVSNVTITNNIIAPTSGQDAVVLTTAGNSTIKVNNNDINVSGNDADGVYLQGSALQIAGNDISVASTTNGRGIVANGTLTGITGNTITTAFDGIYVDGNLGGGAISANTITGTGGTGHVGIAAGPAPTNVTIGSTDTGIPFNNFNAISGFATGIFVDNGNSSVVVREAVTTFTNISGAAIALDPTSEGNVNVVEGVLQLTGISVSTDNLANVDAAQIGGKGYFVANGSTSALQQGLDHTGAPATMFLSADDHTAGGTVTATTDLSGLTISSPTGATAAIDLTDDTNAQNITLVGTGNVSVTGSNTANIINASGMTGGSLTADGGLGDDTISGGTGNDTITGGAGDDTQSGGSGNDVFIIADAADHVSGETINGGANTDVIRFTAATGTLTLDASTTGIEEVRASDALGATTGTANVNIDASAVTGPLTLTGNDGDNELTGTSGADTLVGNGGNDTLTGGAGTDVYQGGAGNDTYNLGIDTEAVTEGAGAGTDTVNVAATYTLAANVENLNLLGTGNFDGTGNDEANTITGNTGDNVLTGGIGADTLTGGSGTDTAAYAGNARDFDVSGTAASSGFVTSFADGTTVADLNTTTLDEGSDTLNSIEKIAFADRTLDLGQAVQLFDGNSLVGTFSTIQAAIDASQAGDTVLVSAGTYIENLTVDEDITLISTTGASNVTISGTISVTASGATIGGAGQGFTISVGANANALTVNPSVTGVAITGNTITGSSANAGVVSQGSAAITSNTISGFIAGVFVTGSGTTGNSISGNTLTGNGTAVWLDHGTLGNTVNQSITSVATATPGAEVVDAADGANTVTLTLPNVTTNTLTGTTTGPAGSADETGDTGYFDNLADAATNTGDGGTITLNSAAGADAFGSANIAANNVSISGSDSADTASITMTGAAAQNLTLLGSSQINVTGNAFANTITGNSGANVIDGGSGIDTVNGGAGDDRIIGSLDGGVGLGKDTYDGGADIDTIDYSAATSTVVVNLGNGSGTATGTQIGGGPNADILLSIENVIGGAGADSLTGGAGANVMVGGAGGDTISGGANDGANDTLTGGADGDTFAFAGLFGTDTVTDFEDGTDLLQIDVNGTGSVTVIDSGANVQLNVFDDTGSGAVQVGTIILENEDHTVIDSNDWTLV